MMKHFYSDEHGLRAHLIVSLTMSITMSSFICYGLCSHQMANQSNTYGGFWSDILACFTTIIKNQLNEYLVNKWCSSPRFQSVAESLPRHNEKFLAPHSIPKTLYSVVLFFTLICHSSAVHLISRVRPYLVVLK